VALVKVKPSLKEKTEAVKNLVLLATEAQEICKLILEANGELSPELEKRLDVNSSALLAKVDSYVFIEDHLEAHASLWKRKADACKAIYDRYVKSQEKMRERVKLAMRELNRNELKGDHYRYKLCELKAKLVIDEPDEIPSELKMAVTKFIPDNERIKSLLEDGIDVPGAHLEPVYSLRVYENAEE
jgi:hypothetical protein